MSIHVMSLGALERWCVCRGDQPIQINVAVKMGAGTDTYEFPLDFKLGGISPAPVAAPLHSIHRIWTLRRPYLAVYIGYCPLDNVYMHLLLSRVFRYLTNRYTIAIKHVCLIGIVCICFCMCVNIYICVCIYVVYTIQITL